MSLSKSDNRQGMTYAEIASELGVSVERVRQIERRALNKLRAAFEKLGLKKLDDEIS